MATTATPVGVVYTSGKHEFEYDLSDKATATGQYEQTTGLVGWKCWFSATDGGAFIHVALEIAAAERASAPGVYYGVFPQTDLATHLAAYVGTKVWRVFGKAGEVLVSSPVMVRATRAPTIA